ncbi:carbohydrate-binding family 9-like protein [Mucilaginibacter sp. UR6-1]|uniref:carbohydrate-binding family 9-like protein n=1 Tax=Mucilaginibacter sp. UR6-1 TaxID=1435643 RepID=UPI001E5B4A16|nr:carbohydrate-binding family 9-like protein [Mucilaginibacter sp. UR6-1]MCC8410656.1 carbohydrate-binding family 9-like protein [Mucilaginibacter sp. UR6-1]
MYKYLFCCTALLAATTVAKSQSEFGDMANLFTTPEHYIITHTNHAPVIDGDVNDKTWQQAKWTTSFVDIEGDAKPKPQYNTRLKMLWDDTNLYIAVKMDEPHLWAYLTHHDDIIFQDNDFELFVDPDNDGRNYFEVEVNQLNKIFDLFLPKAYRHAGDALISWDTPGMRSAVKLQGTLNNPKDTDKGWTVEFAIPFKAIMFGFNTGKPDDGSLWRINFSRVEWDTKVVNGKYVKLKDANGKNLPERNWVWSAPGLISMHYPERWGYLQFTGKTTSEGIKFNIPYTDMQKRYLWLVYYKQQDYFKQHKYYSTSLKDLGIAKDEYNVYGKNNELTLYGTKLQYTATVTDGSGATTSINEDGLFKQAKK